MDPDEWTHILRSLAAFAESHDLPVPLTLQVYDLDRNVTIQVSGEPAWVAWRDALDIEPDEITWPRRGDYTHFTGHTRLDGMPVELKYVVRREQVA